MKKWKRTIRGLGKALWEICRFSLFIVFLAISAGAILGLFMLAAYCVIKGGIQWTG